jgi:twitching motility protein PilT
MAGRMDIDFADLLMEVVHRRASDLHLSSGAHPTVRVRGKLSPLEDYPKLSPTDTREIVYSILTGDQRQRLETNWQLATRASASTPTTSAGPSAPPSA